MDATYSSETSVHFQWIRRNYIPEDKILLLNFFQINDWMLQYRSDVQSYETGLSNYFWILPSPPFLLDCISMPIWQYFVLFPSESFQFNYHIINIQLDSLFCITYLTCKVIVAHRPVPKR
jgi:hypothetical protein